MLISFRATRVADMGPPEAEDAGIPAVQYMCLVLLMLVALFASVIRYWVRAAHSQEQPPPLHVTYIIAPYKPELAAFEVERLVRKMTLAVISTVYPSTLYPMMQSCLMGLVLTTSLIAYSQLKPYTKDGFNRLKDGLIALGVLMVLLTLLQPMARLRGQLISTALYLAGAMVALLAISSMATLMTCVCALMFQERQKN